MLQRQLVERAILGAGVSYMKAAKALQRANRMPLISANHTQLSMYNQTRADQTPWRVAGGNAVGALSSYYGLPGANGQAPDPRLLRRTIISSDSVPARLSVSVAARRAGYPKKPSGKGPIRLWGGPEGFDPVRSGLCAKCFYQLSKWPTEPSWLGADIRPGHRRTWGQCSQSDRQQSDLLWQCAGLRLCEYQQCDQ